MATAINAPLNVNFQNGSQLTREIQGSVDRVKFNNLGGEKGFRSLSQPLGRLTGQADEFTKSLDAANARVLAFGASVGIVNAVSNAFKSLVNSTIEVEKAITAISVVGDKFSGKSKELSQGLFSIAKATGQSFAEVSKAALEFARQGEGVEETLRRTKDALILTRTTGLDAAKSVDGLTAAVNAFAKAGLSTTQVINKLAAVDQAFAVSSADLIEAFQRTGAVAQQAGVSFDELAGIVTALQTETSRGGAVIGNALKTIFSRLQDSSTLTQLKDLGVAVVDVKNNVLPARQILQNLAGDIQKLGKVTQAGVFKDVAGTFQLNQLVSLVNDLNKAQSISASATQKSAGATNEAYVANEKLNQSLDAILNKVITTGKQLGSVLGDIGLTDNLKGLLDGVNYFLEGVNNVLQGDDIGSRFAKGLVKGIGAVLSGPGLGIFLAIIVKLSSDLFRFGAESLKTFFNIGKAASDQKQIQESIVQVLLRNRSVLKEIENTQGGQNAQALKFLGILNQQAAAMKDVQGLASNIAGKAYSAGYRQTERGLARRSAGGYLPAQEASDVRRGVGGASPSSKVVSIPNFAFGGGKRGTMVANTSEYIVPNYAGGGSAIFNQDMVKTMGLPAGAKKINAAGGFVPNFASETSVPKDVSEKYALITNQASDTKKGITFSHTRKDGETVPYIADVYGIDTSKFKGSPELYERRFSAKKLQARYTNLAIKDAKNFAEKAIGLPLSPVSIQNLTNAGSVPSLAGTIFETAIQSILTDDELINLMSEKGGQNARFDFIGPATSKIGPFFGIEKNIPYYLEAKSTLSPNAKKSFAAKIDSVERGNTAPAQEISNIASIKAQWLAYQNRENKRSGFEDFNSIARSLNIDPTKADKASTAKKINKIFGTASTGYIPNFAAAALQQAIAREKSAGLSNSQIYVDQNSSLKSPLNPMGLMVANTRDEPFGGIQGISRARNEGANPKTYGAANGFVPNYALQAPIGQVSAIKGILKQDKVDAFNKALEDTAKQLKNNQISLSQAEQNIEIYAQTVGTSTKGQKILESEGKKLIQAYDSESKAIKQKAEELRKQRSEKQASPTSPESSKSPKPVGDSLAKVIGIQSAAIGLQQVFESLADEGSDFAKTTKSIGGAIAAVSSGFTLLTAGLGGLGIVLAGVTIGFNLLRDVFPDALQSIKESFGGLSLEGQKASKALDDFAEKVARGGVSVEEALKSAEQQASDAILRTKAKQKGIKTETETGERKDPSKLARELVIEQARENLQNEKLGVGISRQIPLKPDDKGYVIGRPKYREQKSELLFSDLNTATQNTIFDILEESVSTTKSGLIALGKEIAKNDPTFDEKEFKELISEDDVLNYRSQLLTALTKGPMSKVSIANSISGSITDAGEIDQNKLQKVLADSGLTQIPLNILKYISKKAKKIEDASPGNLFRANIDDLIRTYSDFSSSLNRAINNRISLLEGYTSSQTFAGLNEEDQFKTKSALDRFKSNTSFESQKRGLTEEVQSTFKPTLQNLEAISGVDPDKINKLSSKLSTLDVGDLEGFLNEFRTTVNLTGPALEEFENNVSKLNNKNKDLFANRETEVQLLNFSIQERQNELNSIKAFYGGMDKFTEGIRKQEARLRKIDFDIRTNQQTSEFRKQMLDIQAPNLSTLRQSTLDIETEAFQNEQDLRLEQAGIQAKIELDRKLYTLENITALNRNTDVLYEILKSNQEQSLVEDIKKINQDIVSKGGATPEQAANLIASQNALQSLRSTTSNLSSVAISDKFKNLVEAPTDDARKLILDSIPNEAQRNNLKQAYEEYSNSLKIASENSSREQEFFNRAQKQLKEKQAAEDSYTQALNQSVISLERSILSNPMSRGQFAAAQRNLSIAQEEQKIFAEKGADGVQEYRSSFGRGLEEGLIPIEERILDFRNQLGKEIPDLFSSNLAQGLNDAISGAKDLKTALTDAATSFFQEITRKNISNLADMATKGLGSLAETGFSALKSAFPGGVTTKASGGFIKGGSGTKDDVPAMLMGGEYVVKKSAVSKYGKGFLDAINSGNMRGYATGGIVDPQTFPTQTGSGGFFTPGDYGQGAITGKNELLTFASQSFTGGQYDYMGGFGMGGATVSLEPESARLSALGREGSPMFERVQQSKDEAFRVYLEGLQKEKEYSALLDQIAKDKKARKKQLQMSIISAVASSALNAVGSVGMTGAKNAVAAASKAADIGGKTLGAGAKFMAGAKGFFTGSGGQGGLANIFKGTGTQLSDLVIANQNAKIMQALQGSVQGQAKTKSLASTQEQAVISKKLAEMYSNVNVGTQGIARATAYGNKDIDLDTAAEIKSGKIKDAWQYLGNTGAKLQPGKSVASNVFKTGTILKIGKKEYIVQDIGGMGPNIIDFYAGSNKKQYQEFANMGDAPFTIQSGGLKSQKALKKLFGGDMNSFRKFQNMFGVSRAAGGLISGGSNVRDDVPAMLTGGEFVLNNRATQRLGVQNLNKLNSGSSISSEGTAPSEVTQALMSKLDELIEATQGSSQSSVVVNVSSTDQQEENPADMNERDKELQKKIRQAVLDVIAQEKRLGGSLEKSR